MTTYTKAVPKPTYQKATKTSRPRRVAPEANPLEESEQLTVVEWLRVHKIRFHASPNGGLRHAVVAMRMKRLGCSPGFPDIMIFDRPPIVEGGLMFVGCAIEMKRRKEGTVSPEQKEWLAALTELGWAAKVCRGCDEAIAYLEYLGYGGKL